MPIQNAKRFGHLLWAAVRGGQARAEDMPGESQTGTTKAFQWAEGDYGKVCGYAAAYENESLERGPWSNVVSLLVG